MYKTEISQGIILGRFFLLDIWWIKKLFLPL
nr:MAG TPA: hypothetical protein [Caudoviricetes sp.]